MRIQVNWIAERIPVCYRMMFLSVLKEAIRLADPAYYETLYQGQKASPKPYSFAVFLRQFSYTDTDEITAKQIQLNVNTPDYIFGSNFLGGLQQIREHRYRQYLLLRKNIRYIPDQDIRDSRIRCTTLSPILVEDENGKPLAPWDDNYNTHLNHLMEIKAKALIGRGLLQPIRLTPVNMKRKVIKEVNDTYLMNRAADKPYLFFTAYAGSFILEGHPADLTFAVQSGVGRRSGQGFGTISLL